MENSGILYVFPVFHSAWMAKKISSPAADDLFRVSLVPETGNLVPETGNLVMGEGLGMSQVLYPGPGYSPSATVSISGSPSVMSTVFS